MRSFPLALALALSLAVGASAQQPSPDTAMRGMPGMRGQGQGQGQGQRKGKGQGRAPVDSAGRGMPGMRHPTAADTSKRGMPGMSRPAAPGKTSVRGMSGMAPAAMPPAMVMPMVGPIGIPDARAASGTAWQPDLTPMYAVHAGGQGAGGGWSFMLHGNAFLQSIHDGSERGEEQLGSVNWFMGMARHPLGGARGDLTLRGMLSLEPLTVGKCGYPDLLASGERCNGEPLHDRQHPHDLFMEVAAQYRTALTHGLALELYGGAAGEPALGPVAFPHRASALWTPIAPIGHHWEDATHVAFGVVTGGIYGRQWKLEGSAFNGREPDDRRFDFDLAPLDSYAGRLWLAPGDKLTLQVSTGYLRAAEQVSTGDRVDVHRTTASVEYELPVGEVGSWASTLVWGRNRTQGRATGAALLGSALDLDGRNVLHGRAEVVDKTGEDLALSAPAAADQVFRVGKLALGYSRVFAGARGRGRGQGRALAPTLGAELSLDVLPAPLWPFYGPGTAWGFAVYASVHPAPLRMAPMAMEPVRAPLPGGSHGEMMSPPADSGRTTPPIPRP